MPATPFHRAPLKKHTSLTAKELGGFEILSKIGEGGMATVFKARQKELNRIVAVKILAQKWAGDDTSVKRLYREARASASLNHPNIVQGIDVGFAAGVHYFAMEYVEGPSVGKRLDDGHVFEEKEVLAIARQVAQGLVCAHEAGLIHRDIKPDNIILAKSGEVKLADLGLVITDNSKDASLTQTGTVVGTPYYIAPEQALRKDVDARSDLYSLGATLFYMVTGKRVFEGATGPVVVLKHLNDSPPTARSVNPNVSEACSTLIGKLLRKDKDRRFASARELIEALDEVLLNSPGSSTPPKNQVVKLKRGKRKGARRRTSTRIARSGVGMGFIAFLILSLVGGGALYKMQGPSNEKQLRPPPQPPQTGSKDGLPSPLAESLTESLSDASHSKIKAGLRGASSAKAKAPARTGPTKGTANNVPTHIQERFKGKVDAYDAATGEISLFYNFEDPDQLKDWEPLVLKSPRKKIVPFDVSSGQLKEAAGRDNLEEVHGICTRAQFRLPVELSLKRTAFTGSRSGCGLSFMNGKRSQYSHMILMTRGRKFVDGKKKSFMEIRHGSNSYNVTLTQFLMPTQNTDSITAKMIFTESFVESWVNGISIGKALASEFTRNNQQLDLNRPMQPCLIMQQTFGIKNLYFDDLRIKGRLDPDWLKEQK